MDLLDPVDELAVHEADTLVSDALEVLQRQSDPLAAVVLVAIVDGDVGDVENDDELAVSPLLDAYAVVDVGAIHLLQQRELFLRRRNRFYVLLRAATACFGSSALATWASSLPASSWNVDGFFWGVVGWPRGSAAPAPRGP